MSCDITMAQISMLKKRLFYLVLLLCLSIAFWSRGEPAAHSTPATQPAMHLVILHVNDVHGQLQGRTIGGKPWGGYARLATAVDDIRKQVGADRVFLIHAGDAFSKGDALSTATKGRADVALMNAIGFDIWTPGNGEFYNGIDNLRRRMAEAQCKIICGNITYKATGKLIAEPFVIERVGPVRVAFLGLGFIHREHRSSAPLNLGDPLATARRLVPEVRKQADVVVAVTHLGFPGDCVLAAAVPGIDLIIGGHSHTILPNGKSIPCLGGGSTLVCQAGSYLDYLGRADLKLSKDAEGRWKVVEATDTLIPLDAKVKQDPRITALIARLSADRPAVPALR